MQSSSTSNRTGNCRRQKRSERQSQSEILRIKQAVRDRDGGCCTKCGVSSFKYAVEHGRNLDVHRLTPGSAYSLDGCVTLCRQCHAPLPRRRRGSRLWADGIATFRAKAVVFSALQKFREKYEFPPSFSEIMDRALRMYLRSKGFNLPEQASDA
jgi:hypothetical protein